MAEQIGLLQMPKTQCSMVQRSQRIPLRYHELFPTIPGVHTIVLSHGSRCESLIHVRLNENAGDTSDQ